MTSSKECSLGTRNVDADNLRFGAMLIDASRPVADVVDHLLTGLDLTLWREPT